MAVPPREVGKVVSLANQTTSGALGPAFVSTDTRVIVVNQTTASLSFTLPSPSDTSVIVGIDVENSGSVSFGLYGALVQPSTFVRCIWSGSAWNVSAGEIAGTQIVTSSSATIGSNVAMVYVNYSSGSVALSGPSPPAAGGHFAIKDGSGTSVANPIVYTPGSGITIEGASSYTLADDSGSVSIWIISPTVQVVY